MKPLNETSHSGEGGPAICIDTYKTMNIYREIEGALTPFSKWLELFLTWIMAANQSRAIFLNYLEETLLKDLGKEHPAQSKLKLLHR